MNGLKVKRESLSKRCEICHQTDCFTAELNHCSRCEKTKIQTPTNIDIVNTNVNRKPRRIMPLRSLTDSNDLKDYLTPYNWFLAQEARSNLVRIERQIKNWWKSDKVTEELVVAPVVWTVLSTILMTIFYMVTKNVFFTLLASAGIVAVLIAVTIGTATKWFLKKREVTQLLETERVATDNYISNLLYEE